MKTIVFFTVCAFIALIMSMTQCISEKEKRRGDEYVTFGSHGELVRPQDYRSWVLAGTVTTPNILDSAAIFADFQNVYIDPVSFAFWKENGYFGEGTVMVKELLNATDRRHLPIGNGFVQGGVTRFSVTIKDTLKYPDVPGGWEYFRFAPGETGDYEDDTMPVGVTLGCIACHANAKEGFGPFAELYAPLRDAKGFGKGSPENLRNRNALPSAQLPMLTK